MPGKGSFVSEKAFKNDSVHDTAASEISDAISAARAKGLKSRKLSTYSMKSTLRRKNYD